MREVTIQVLVLMCLEAPTAPQGNVSPMPYPFKVSKEKAAHFKLQFNMFKEPENSSSYCKHEQDAAPDLY